MDFIEQLQALAVKVPKLREHLLTEEATKNALVMPFIGILGYDIFDPTEVLPEFIADVGIKKGEKVDYAIIKDGKIVMLFECKKCGTDLEQAHASQLYRYFSVTDARIGVLTDGVAYRFYTDLEAPNKMDAKPFMEFNILDIQEPIVAELKRLTKPSFNMDQMISAAVELKYTREVKRILGEQLASPSDDFVRLFASQLHNGAFTQKTREKFADITKRGFNQFINERINERLKSAMTGSPGVTLNVSEAAPAGDVAASEEPAETNDKEGRVITTDNELEGFYIVKAILREVVDPARVVARDQQSYFGVLLDNNNRKPICRLHFNRGQKYIGVFNEDKKEERLPVADLNDIYKHAARLKAVVANYDKGPSQKEPDGPVPA